MACYLPYWDIYSSTSSPSTPAQLFPGLPPAATLGSLFGRKGHQKLHSSMFGNFCFWNVACPLLNSEAQKSQKLMQFSHIFFNSKFKNAALKISNTQITSENATLKISNTSIIILLNTVLFLL